MPSRVIDAETRHRVMASIRKRDTRPEIAVRRALHAQGLRFRLHRNDLPGTPDVVLPGRRLAVFVHGCFWHQHPGCKWSRMPSGNTSYWGPKLARNVARDAKARQQLEALGWNVLVVWECDAQDVNRLRHIVQRIALSHIDPLIASE
ncbi:MAG: very short patch repair endonuclease [Geminicoccaceae bacterium]